MATAHWLLYKTAHARLSRSAPHVVHWPRQTQCTNISRNLPGIPLGCDFNNASTTKILASTTDFIELLPSPKKPVEDNKGRCFSLATYVPMWHEKVTSGTFTCIEPAMYPKILEAQSPDIASRIYGTYSMFITYYPCVYTSPKPLYAPMALKML